MNRAVAFAVACVALLMAAGIALRLMGYVGGAYSWFLFSQAGDDSWMPMALGFDRVGHGGALRDVFFVDHVKFQYPPTSLLIYSLISSIGLTPSVKLMNALVCAAAPVGARVEQHANSRR